MDTKDFALGKQNLILIGIAFAVIILGFALMAGPGSTPEHYNPDIFSFRRISRYCVCRICVYDLCNHEKIEIKRSTISIWKN